MPIDKDKLEKYVSSGMAINKIAKEVGLGHSTIVYWMKRYGLVAINNYAKIRKNKQFLCSCGATEPSLFYDCRLYQCKKCYKRQLADKKKDNKRLLVEYAGGKCQSCGYSKCMAALHFHHLDPTKKDPQWEHLRQWNLEKAKKQIDGCHLLCSNCHAEVHWSDECLDES